MSDAVSHAILLGIVVMFLVVQRLDSPLLVWVFSLDGLKYYGFLIVSHLYFFLFFIWLLFFYKICFLQYIFYLNLGMWLYCGSLAVDWEFKLDSLSIIMVGLVLSVSTAVHIFFFRLYERWLKFYTFFLRCFCLSYVYSIWANFFSF